jgi:hypothetical protein
LPAEVLEVEEPENLALQELTASTAPNLFKRPRVRN